MKTFLLLFMVLLPLVSPISLEATESSDKNHTTLESGLPLSPSSGDLDAQLVAAVQKKDLSALSDLLAKKANPDTRIPQDGKPILALAAELGWIDGVKVLLNYGAGVNARCNHVNDIHEMTAVMFAAQNGHNDIIKALIEHEKNISFKRKTSGPGADYSSAVDYAVSKKHISTIKLLLEFGDKATEKSLLDAVDSGDADLVKLLLAHGAPPDSIWSSGTTVLAGAAAKGNVEIVRALLEHGADINMAYMYGTVPIVAGARYPAVIKLLLDHGADVNTLYKRGDTPAPRTPLMIAVESNAVDAVKFLLDNGADPTIVSKFDNFFDRGPLDNNPDDTALTLAAKKGRLDILKILLAKISDPSQKKQELETTINVAQKCGYSAIVEFLESQGARVDNKANLEYEFLEAAIHNDVDTLAKLLDEGVNPEVRDNDGNTALILFSNKGNKEALEILVNKGADLNARDQNGNTAFLITVKKGYLELASLFLENGADIKITDKGGQGAVHWAAAKDYLALLKVLAGKGADLNQIVSGDSSKLLVDMRGGGGTPLIFAAFHAHTDIVEFLISKKVDLNSTLSNGWTALHLASFKGYEKIVELLINKGADLNSRALDKKTPLSNAAIGNHTEVVRLLLARGADLSPPLTLPLILNGSFNKSLTDWTARGDCWAGVDLKRYNSAPGYAALGVNKDGYAKDNADGMIYQELDIPKSRLVKFSFFYSITTKEKEEKPADKMNVFVENLNSGKKKILAELSNIDQGPSGAYQKKTLDISAFSGQKIRIGFAAKTNAESHTTFRIDDVQLFSIII